MKFDKFFYAQRNRDESGTTILLDDFDNCRMNGTEKYPVRTMGEIDDLEVDHDIFGTSPEPDKITLKLIVIQWYYYDLMPHYMRPHYMRFLFYDFHKTVHLFLFNAKIMKVNEILMTDRRQQYSLMIASTKNAERPAYRVFEIKHGAI